MNELKPDSKGASQAPVLYRRFGRMARLLHALLIVSFLGLSISGMLLRFSSMRWAHAVSRLLGGAEAAGRLHRGFASLLFAVFILHLLDLLRLCRGNGGWKAVLFGPNSMLPNGQDLRLLFASLRWFAGAGERPQYGRYTYWEKFDYFAVFWGVWVIGSSGLVLCFPVTFSHYFSGEWVNVASAVHSEEAMLAVAFIFMIHFYNTHLRPDRFPMDLSIFTGYITLEELRRERPAEFAALQITSNVNRRRVRPHPFLIVLGIRLFAGSALMIGVVFLLTIGYSLLSR